jgi:cytochrome P450
METIAETGKGPRLDRYNLTSTTELSLSEINLGSLDTFARDDLHGVFAKLRHEKPVSWHQHPDSGRYGFWAIVRYEDIVAINRDPKTFSNSQGVQLLVEDDVPRAGRGSMIEADPPRHTRLRRLIAPAFTSAAVSQIDETIRKRVREILDTLEGKDEIEFVTEFATPIPMVIFYDLMGVPRADQAKVLKLADRLFFSADPRLGGDQTGFQRAGEEMQAYGRWLAEKRLADPADDLWSKIVHASVDGERLTVAELGSFWGLLGAAGADTTRATLTFALSALTDFPDQKSIWLSDIVGRASTAVDEIVRWASPTMHMRRTATRDIEFAGQSIREGDKLALWFSSGNRDDTKFAEPYRLDIRRSPNPHMGFGMSGPHFCVGAHLAKAEIRIALTELLARFPDIVATAPPSRLRSNFINGPFALSARLRK